MNLLPLVEKGNFLLEILFHDYRWCRWFVGGRWENWYIECLGRFIWIKMDFRTQGKPGNSRGNPTIETWA